MPNFTIHPILPSHSFGPATLSKELVVGHLRLDEQAEVVASVETYRTPLASLSTAELGVDRRAWETALQRIGLGLLEES